SAHPRPPDPATVAGHRASCALRSAVPGGELTGEESVRDRAGGGDGHWRDEVCVPTSDGGTRQAARASPAALRHDHRKVAQLISMCRWLQLTHEGRFAPLVSFSKVAFINDVADCCPVAVVFWYHA